MSTRNVLAGVLLLSVIITLPCAAAEPVAPQLKVTCPSMAWVFDVCELSVTLPDPLQRLPDTQVNDAYDADRDGQYIRLDAEFMLDKETVRVPGFAMRDTPNGPWRWRIRFAPRRAGEWQGRVTVNARAEGEQYNLSEEIALPIDTHVEEGITGPLVAPGKNDSPGYLRKLRADGTSEATWLFGACRAWVIDPWNGDDWSSEESLDRETELFAPMRAGGFNLLNQWMAPWEFLIIHHDRAEFWRVAGKWQRVPLANGAPWTPYQCYDQGRAKAFDSLVRQCEGDPRKPTIYLLLSPLPHQCLQVKEHPWGGQESGWSPENDGGKQTPDRLNGFSGFRAGMNVWEFFEADPSLPLIDRRSQLFDHQANYYRYLIARWGGSRAIGVWVLVDELDAIGDVIGSRARKTGWWEDPDCERWLADIIKMFRGEMKRSDGLVYAGDPYHHPLHAATTSFGGEAGRGGNIDWEGGPEGARPDLFGFHWYPRWFFGASWTGVWAYTIEGVANYASAPIGNVPRLISEFGAPDRELPSDIPSLLYPSLYHYAIWAGIFSGQAGTPMDWDDGKEFGELRSRARKGAFDKEHYPIDHVAQMNALHKFLGALKPDQLRACAKDAAVQCKPTGDLCALSLYASTRTDAACGWVFAPGTDTRFSILGLAPGGYSLRWYDPWTGDPVAGMTVLRIDLERGDRVDVDAAEVLKMLRDAAAPEAFPDNSRLARGMDAAFKIERR